MSLALREIAVLAFADELVARPAMLHSWFAHFGEADPFTLAIHPGTFTAADVVGRLSGALEEAGLDPDLPDSPDLQLLTGPFEPGEEVRLAGFCVGVLSHRAVEAPFSQMRRIDPELLGELRGRFAPVGAQEQIDPEGDVINERRNEIDDRALRMVMAASLLPDSDAIDVGAHSGEVIADLLRFSPHGRVLAFEPLPQMAARLRTRFPGVDVRETALSHQAGTATFLHVAAEPAFSGLRERTYPPGAEESIERIQVRLSRLDDEVGDLVPRFIKIDVEGAELGVLRGATGTLERHRPALWFEHGRGASDHYGTTPGEVWDLLTAVGLDRIYDADANGPLSRGAFEESFALGRLWNYFARAGS